MKHSTLRRVRYPSRDFVVGSAGQTNQLNSRLIGICSNGTCPVPFTRKVRGVMGRCLVISLPIMMAILALGMVLVGDPALGNGGPIGPSNQPFPVTDTTGDSRLSSHEIFMAAGGLIIVMEIFFFAGLKATKKKHVDK